MMTESLDNIVIGNINIEIKSILHINSTLEPIIFLHDFDRLTPQRLFNS